LGKDAFNESLKEESNKEAIVHYSKAISLHPHFREARVKRAAAFFGTKQFDKAVEDFNVLIEEDPDDGASYNDRGQAKLEQENVQDAIADLSRAIEKRGRNFSIWNSYESRAMAYMEAGEYRKAAEDLSNEAELILSNDLFSLIHITTFRALYPEYDGVSDEVLAHKLNRMFFPEMAYKDYSAELRLSPGLRQTVKTQLTVRCFFIVPDPGTVLG
jgi:tetratricopeptide (TPR) repeat protein